MTYPSPDPVIYIVNLPYLIPHAPMKRFLSTIAMGALVLPSLAFADGHSSNTSATQTRSSSVQADSSAQHTFSLSFLETFMDVVTSDTGLRTAFDVRQFRSHPCYEAIGNELDYCTDLFGITSDFHSMIQDNTMAKLLVEYTLKNRCSNMSGEDHKRCLDQNAAAGPQIMSQLVKNGFGANGSLVASDEDEDESDENEEDDDTTVNPVSEPMQRHQRAARVWQLCKDQGRMQAGCYQDHLRFVTDNTLSFSSLERMLSNSARNK